MGRNAKEREFMRKHILPILLVLLMVLLVGCSQTNELPKDTEISSSSVGEFSELKQDENLTDEPSRSETVEKDCISICVKAERVYCPPSKGECPEVNAERGRGIFLVDSVSAERTFTEGGEIIVKVSI